MTDSIEVPDESETPGREVQAAAIRSASTHGVRGPRHYVPTALQFESEYDSDSERLFVPDVSERHEVCHAGWNRPSDDHGSPSA